MQAAVDHFFEQEVFELTSKLAEFEHQVEPLSYPENNELLTELGQILSAGLAACRELDSQICDNPELLKRTQEQFRAATAPWCNQSWIINRARSKPRGFPGDYQMLLAIYDGIPIARGLGGYLDRLCLQMTLGQAVDARLSDCRMFLEDELNHRNGTVNVLDIASGPGHEFRNGFGRDFENTIHITCVDSDQGALEYIRRHASIGSPSNMHFHPVQHNALRLRSGDYITKTFGRQDIIYSVGLADYIPDKLLIPMLRGWRESLNPEGCIYVAFKDALMYDKVEYQWFMDWHFLQRDESQCSELLAQAGYDVDSLDITRDQTGVIINYLARPKVSAYHRVDHNIPQTTAPLLTKPNTAESVRKIL